jgi:hypothetical protein
MANAKTAIKRLKNALDKKYEVSQPAPVAGAVGDGKLFIDGQLYNGAVAGVTQVVNVGRPAAAQYAAKTGGGVIVQSGGGSAVSAGSGSGPDVTALSLLTVVGEAALTSDRYLDVTTALTKTDGGAGGALTIGLATPGGLTVSSTNVATGNHTHAIASSSAPGAAASILASSAAGLLTLPNFTATTGVRTPLIDTASGALTLTPGGASTIINGNVTIQRSGVAGTAGIYSVGDTSGIYPRLALFRARNVLGAEQATVSADILGALSFRGHDGTAYETTGAAEIRGVASETFTPTANGATLRFFTTAVGSTTLSERLRIHNSGNVSILNTTDGGFALDVTGTARASTSLTTPLITTASNVDLVINPAGTGAVQFPNDQTLRTTSFDSSFPINGWQINEVAGVAGYSALTIGKIQADELAVRVFVADEVRVDRGDEFWTKSYGIVAATFTTPGAIGGTVSVKFEDSPALAGAIFVNNDWVLFRKLEIDTGINLFNVWGQVATYVNNSDGTQNWTFTLRSGPTATEITKGSLAIDFGASGAALIHLSVIDAAGAPYIKMRKWSGANPYTPANFTTYVQLGHLGSTGNAYVTPAGFGLYARSTNDESRFILSDDNGLQIRGASFKMYNSSLQTVDISATDGSVKLGTNIASSSTTGFEFNGATGAVTIGNASYPGTVTVYGSITVTGGNAAKTDFSNITATIDNVPNGTSFHRTTPNQVTGAARAFTALSSGNNLVTSVIPATAIGNPGTAGLYLGSDYMGYHTGSGTAAGWKTYMDSSGNMRLAGNASNNYIQWVAASNKLQGVGGGVEQWYADATDGKLYAGAGAVGMDNSGLWLRMNATATWATTSAIAFRNASVFSTIDAVLSTLTVTGSRYLNLLIDPDSTPVGLEVIKSSTAQRVNITHDLTVQRDANIIGALTVNGTAVTLAGQALPLSGGTLTGTLTSRAITPNADNTHDLGASGARWQDIYAVNLHVGTIVGTPSYSHSHAASDITSGTLDFARIPTTWTGALTLDADSAGTSNYVRWLTQTSTGKAWDLIGRAHDFATAAQQNDMLLTYYDGTTTHIVFQADNTTRIVDFGQTPTVGGTAVSLSGHTHDDRYFTEAESDARYVQTATLSNYLLASGATTGATSQAQTFTNGVRTGNGTALVPAFSFSASDSTGIYRQAVDSLSIATVGTERLRVNASGQISINGAPITGYVVTAQPATGQTGGMTLEGTYASAGFLFNTSAILRHAAGATMQAMRWVPTEEPQGAITTFININNNLRLDNSAFNVTNVRLAQGQLLSQAGYTGAITSLSMFHALNASLGGATLTNQYGYYCAALSGATNSYAFYSAGSTPSYFGGTVQIIGDAEVTGELLAANGSASAPSIAALSDTNTGLYWSAADTLAVTTGGVLRASFNSSGVTVASAVTVPTINTASGNLTIAPVGGTTSVSGALSLTGTLSSTSWNITSAGAATLVTMTASTKVTSPLIDTASGNLTLTPAGGTVAVSAAITVGTTATITGVTSIASGSVGAPGLTFTGDTNTGLYRSGVDAYSLVAGGAAIINVGATGAGVNAAYDNTAALKVQSVANDDITLFLKQKSGQTARMWRVEDSAGQELIVLDSQGNLQSGNPGFVSGLTGWQITPIGNAELNNAFIRGELHASIFVMDEFHASGGTLYIAPAGKLELDATVNVTAGIEAVFDIRTTSASGTGSQFTIRTTSALGSGTQFTLRTIENYFAITDPPSGHAMILSPGDIIRCKALGLSVGIDLWDIWGVVTRAEDMTDYYRYYFERKSGGTNNLTIPAGTAIISYGKPGDGRIYLTADQNYAPYWQVFITGQEPWNGDIIPTVRGGRLDGVGLPGVSGIEQYGIVMSRDLSDASAPYMVMSNLQQRMYKVDSEWNNGNPTARITANGEFRLGTDVDADNTTGLKFNPATGALDIGNASYPGAVNVRGVITVTGGSGIAAFTDANLDNIANGATFGRINNTIIGGGFIRVGSGDKDSTLNGWYVDAGEIVGQAAGVDQVVLDAGGKIMAGAGALQLDRTAFHVANSVTSKGIQFYNTATFTNGNKAGRLWALNGTPYIMYMSAGRSTFDGDSTNAAGQIQLVGLGASGIAGASVEISGSTQIVEITASEIDAFGDLDMNGYDIIDANNCWAVRSTAAL